MERSDKGKRVALCPACGACPEIVFDGNNVVIGEQGNKVKLKKQEWNDLVKKIKAGELHEV